MAEELDEIVEQGGDNQGVGPSPPGGGRGPMPRPPEEPPTEDTLGPGATVPPAAAPEIQSEVAGSGRLGMGDGFLRSIRSIGQSFLSNVRTEKSTILRDFSKGLFTAFKRGAQPVGSFADVRNLVPNLKVGGLVQRPGTSWYNSLRWKNAPSPATISDISGLTVLDPASSDTITKLAPFSTEVPSATDIDVLFGADAAGATPVIMQKPFFHNSASATDSWVKWGESIDGITINGAPSGATLVFTGGDTNANYYRGWICKNEFRSQYLYITDSSYSTGDTTLTFSENVPSGWVNADELTLYRSYHENPAFLTANWTKPIALQQGNAILACGGRGSSAGYKPQWSGYLNKIFMASKTPFTFQGTYIGEAEIKTGNGIQLQNVVVSAPPSGALASGNWFLAVSYETDDGQRGILVKPSTAYVAPGSTQGVEFEIRMYAAELNKRIRYINIFAGTSADTNVTSLPWNEYFWVGQWDILDGSAAAWTHTATAGTAPGYHTRTFQLDADTWQSPTVEKEPFDVFVGSPAFTTSTVSFDYAAYVNDVLFVASYYDYGDSTNYTDEIRYSVFASNGIAQINSLRNIPQYTESSIAKGDSANIQGLMRFQDKLLVLKDNSCFFVPVSGTTQDYTLIPISSEVGCDAPYSITSTPFGVVWAKSGDDIYLWRGGDPLPLTQNWKDAYLDFTTTNKAQWYGWYDPFLKSFNLHHYDGGLNYAMYFEVPVGGGQFAWSKHGFDSGVRPLHPQLKYDGTVIFTDNNIGVAQFSNATDKDDPYDVYIQSGGDGVCVPYLDTGDYAVTENELARFREWWIVNNYDSARTPPVSTVAITVLVDGVALQSGGSNPWNAVTSALTRWASPIPISPSAGSSVGSRIRIKFNSSQLASWDRETHTGDDFQIIEIGFGYKLIRRSGAGRKSL